VRDRLALFPGELWEQRLLELIDEADIFQLFWSWNSMRSEYVRREYEHALGLVGTTSSAPPIGRCRCRNPPTPRLPPPELAKLHFHGFFEELDDENALAGPLPEYLRAALGSPAPGIREAAVTELAALLDRAEPGLALAAREALEDVAENHVWRVALLARTALDAEPSLAAERVRREPEERARRLAEDSARRQKEAEERAPAERTRRKTAPADRRKRKTMPADRRKRKTTPAAKRKRKTTPAGWERSRPGVSRRRQPADYGRSSAGATPTNCFGACGNSRRVSCRAGGWSSSR
jgi:hypothetical protein